MKKIILLFCAFACVALSASAAKLKIKLPEAQLVGTEVPIKIENLEREAPPPEIEVPDGVTNLAKGKKVTSSDDFPLIGELELITDGEKDSSEGYYVIIADGLQWVQIDLEKSAELYAIALWHYHVQKRAYKDVIVQVSDDPEFKKGVTTIFNNDHDNSAKLGKGTDKHYVDSHYGKLFVINPPVKARYVRFYSNGNTATADNNYVEVEVYGK